MHTKIISEGEAVVVFYDDGSQDVLSWSEYITSGDSVSGAQREATEAFGRAYEICYFMLDGKTEINGRPASVVLYEALRKAFPRNRNYRFNIENARCTREYSVDDEGLIKAILEVLDRIRRGANGNLVGLQNCVLNYCLNLKMNHIRREKKRRDEERKKQEAHVATS